MTCKYAFATACTTRSCEPSTDNRAASSFALADLRFLLAFQLKILAETFACASVYENGPTTVGIVTNGLGGTLIPTVFKLICSSVSARLPVTWGSSTDNAWMR